MRGPVSDAHPERAGPTLIVAFDDERGIGRDGALPWHHPADLRRFRLETMGATVIVGRATLSSLPGPLRGRRLVVVGRTPMNGLHGASQANDLGTALEMAGPGRCVVAGGAGLYAAALPLAGTILATRVPGIHGCDRHFPAFEGEGWLLESSEPLGGGLTFETWRRA